MVTRSLGTCVTRPARAIIGLLFIILVLFVFVILLLLFHLNAGITEPET